MDVINLDQYTDIPPLVHETIAGISHIDFGFRTYPDPTAWRSQSEREAVRQRPIAAICDAIRRQYADLPEHDRVRENLAALAIPGTMAVVTGQQVGLAGGPLLTLYKAMTTIALAEALQRGTGVRTVPVFWMATGDHNLNEVSQIHWVNLNNEVSGYKFSSEGNKTPVGTVPLGEHATLMFERFSAETPKTDSNAAFLDLLREAYQPERTFSDAFRRVGNSLLGSRGLIFLDPEDDQIKRLSTPFLETAAADADTRIERLLERSKLIQRAGYKSQALVEAGRPALFLIDDGQRRKIVLEGRAIRGHTDIILSRDELARIARDKPESLSAGVTLRPLLQGWLLPTGAYVAGPHEMAYWAQLTDVFAPLNIPKPAVVPRASLTLVEPKVRRWLDKYQIKPADLFADPDQLSARMLAGLRDNPSDHAFADFRDLLKQQERVFTDLTRGADFIGLEGTVEASFRKFHYHLDKLRAAFAERSRRRHGDLLKHIAQLSNHLFPAGNPQERAITPFYYLVRYGDAILDGLHRDALRTVGRHAFVDIREWI